MSHLTIATRVANPVLTAWAAVAGGLFDKAYEAHGYTKHDIEAMETDRQYEEAIVGFAISAYEDWVKEGDWEGSLPLHHQPKAWDQMSIDEQVEFVNEALNAGSYGSYRGDLPETTRAVLLHEPDEEPVDDEEEPDDRAYWNPNLFPKQGN